MTTISYKDGILAADQQGNHHGVIIHGVNKIFKGESKDGPWGFGVAGSGPMFVKMMDRVKGHSTGHYIRDKDAAFREIWGESLEDLKLYEEESGTALVVGPKSELYIACSPDFVLVPIGDQYFSVGSGGDFAMGAMSMGASAVESIGIAAKYCPNTGNTVRFDCIHPQKDA